MQKFYLEYNETSSEIELKIRDKKNSVIFSSREKATNNYKKNLGKKDNFLSNYIRYKKSCLRFYLLTQKVMLEYLTQDFFQGYYKRLLNENLVLVEKYIKSLKYQLKEIGA